MCPAVDSLKIASKFVLCIEPFGLTVAKYLQILYQIIRLTLRIACFSVGWGWRTHLLSTTKASAVKKDGQVYNVAHVIMAVDVGVTQYTVQVLVDSFNNDVRVTGKDRDEWTFGEKHPHLEIKRITSRWPMITISTSYNDVWWCLNMQWSTTCWNKRNCLSWVNLSYS